MDLAYNRETFAALDSDLSTALGRLEEARINLTNATNNMIDIALAGSDTAEGVRIELDEFNVDFDNTVANLTGLRKGADTAQNNAFDADAAARAMFA
ncbi:hypothetical protein [Nocardia sp. NBC_00416]|uniref:hypothetical protein n=1 Tax=Nocardia sp. NBC_00416 TaxID=2975991 RepID=UPI002E1BC2D5